MATQVGTRLGKIDGINSGAGHFLRFFKGRMYCGCGLAKIYNFPLAHAFISASGHAHNTKGAGIADFADQGFGL
jgi:hypothetical protein